MTFTKSFNFMLGILNIILICKDRRKHINAVESFLGPSIKKENVTDEGVSL